MRKLLFLNIAALAMTATLAVVLVRMSATARQSLVQVAELGDQSYDATEIRRQMLLMGDSMRGFLLDPSKTAEWDAKMAADEALAKKVEELLGQITNPEHRALAE